LIQELGSKDGGTLDVYGLILKDPGINQEIELLIGSGKSAPLAVDLVFQRLADSQIVGLGVDELSMAAAHIPRAKELVRGLSYADCRALAQQAMELETNTDIRNLLQKTEK
jgi:phosphocarrier protein FPr